MTDSTQIDSFESESSQIFDSTHESSTTPLVGINIFGALTTSRVRSAVPAARPRKTTTICGRGPGLPLHWTGVDQHKHAPHRSPPVRAVTTPDTRNGSMPGVQQRSRHRRHTLLRCPCLCGTRLHAPGNIHGDWSTCLDIRQDNVVAALAAGFRSFMSHQAALPRQKERS